MTACAGNKGTQGSQELDLPPLREAVCPHHSHSEREVLYLSLFRWQDQTEFCYSTNSFTDCCVCMWVSPLTKTCTRDKPVCLLKIPLRSQEADRTEKPSHTLHEVSYSNFIKLMDLNWGFWHINSAQIRHQVSWWRCRTSSYKVWPKGQQGILKYRTNSMHSMKVVLGLQLQNCNQHLALWF